MTQKATSKSAAVPAMSDLSTATVATAIHGAGDADALFWSIRGEIACAAHMPPQDSHRWSEERWAEIPSEMRNRHGRRYQCQHCGDSKTPIVHTREQRLPQ